MNRRWLSLVVVAVAALVVGLALQGATAPAFQVRTPSPSAVAQLGSSGGATPPNTLGSPAASPESEAAGEPSAAGQPPPTDGPAPSAGSEASLARLLALLRIAPESRNGYSRSLFVHWIDANGDGCDTRHEVLIAEAIVKPVVGAHCSLSGGRWFSLYDGLTFSDPSKLQIDHVVALAEAWDSGASAWTPDRRMRYANDLDAWFALIAVSATTNQGKSDSDPADWLPPAQAAECPFLGAWIATKARWDLAVDQREHDALASDIGACPSTTMPYLPAGSEGETGGQSTPSATRSGTGGSCDPAYPTVCIPPPPPDLDCADIPYRNFEVLPPDPHHFDGDHDGIGCET